ncbi:MAG: acyltransferase family protein, partial [Lactobacillaceae bacterium]
MFIMLCGMTFNNKDVLKKVIFVLSIYLIFQLIYAVPDSIKSGEYIYNIFTPYWILWFLVSLASWMILYRIFGHLKYSIPISIVISVAAGFLPFVGHYFSYMRTLVFMPFFFIGVHLKNLDLSTLINSKRISFIAFVVLSSLFTYVLLKLNIDNRFLFGSYGYEMMGDNLYIGAISRLLVFILSLALSVLLYISIPDGNTFLTRFGVSSLSIYVLHWAVIKVIEKNALYHQLPISQYIYMVMLFIMAIVITEILSIKILDSLIRYCAKKISTFIYTGISNKPSA